MTVSALPAMIKQAARGSMQGLGSPNWAYPWQNVHKDGPLNKDCHGVWKREKRKQENRKHRKNAIEKKQRKANFKGGRKPLPENSGAIFGVPHLHDVNKHQ
jgi:hypothetical protein